MGVLTVLWLLAIALGLLTTPLAPALSRAEPRARRAYGLAVAGALAVVGGGVAVGAAFAGLAGSGALPHLIVASAVPLGLAALLVLAVRDEGRRGAAGWVPFTALAGFPVFLFFAAVILFFDAS